MKIIHEYLININKRSLILISGIIALLAFVAGLWVMLGWQLTSMTTNKVVGVVINAEKLSNLEKSISFQRALRIYQDDLPFAVFDLNCNPIYLTDLKIQADSCLTRQGNATWIEHLGRTGDKQLIAYTSELNFKSIWKESSSILTPLMISYMAFSFGLTFLFFKLFIDVPIIKLSQHVDDVLAGKRFDVEIFKDKNKTIFSTLYIAISKLISEVVKANREEEKLLVTKQIVHDLRAPLSILEGLHNSGPMQNSVEGLAIKRLKDISSKLLKENTSPDKHTVTIDSLLGELIQLYPTVSFTVSDKSFNHVEFDLAISEIDLFRFLSNIVKNSIESGATRISVETSLEDCLIRLAIIDNGKGVKEDLIPQILKGHSTKEDGHGLGISAMYSKLMSINGNLIIRSSEGNGFEIKLLIPLRTANKSEYVLIDNDKLIRLGWQNQASKKGLKFKSFIDVEDFLADANHIPLDAKIFIDSSLNDGKKGEFESLKLFEKGYSNLFLSTGYSKSDFDLSTFYWLKDITSKSAPF